MEFLERSSFVISPDSHTSDGMALRFSPSRESSWNTTVVYVKNFNLQTDILNEKWTLSCLTQQQYIRKEAGTGFIQSTKNWHVYYIQLQKCKFSKYHVDTNNQSSLGLDWIMLFVSMPDLDIVSPT